jgi:hypothetical protein
MELKSFRELLLKKAADNPTLQTIIDVMKDELIAEKVIESLEKMARPQASMGRSANAAVTAFGNQMKNKDVEMMRDALAHHVSHYKSALKNGQRDVADKHLEKIIPLMHLAGKASAHSNGQLGLDYTPLEPWETNYTTPKRIEANEIEPGGRGVVGKLKEGTKGLRRRPNPGAREDNPRAVRDYRYLEMAPHEEHADTKRSPHKGGYPFEEIQIGNPAKIDAKEAYLHLHDPGKQEGFVPHPFDEHPIHDVADEPQGSLKQEQLEDVAQKMQDWHNSEHNAKWMQSIKDAHGKDPEAFKARGKVKPGHHFEGMQLLQQPHHKQLSSDEVKVLPQAAAKFVKPQEVAPAQVKAEAPKAAISSKDMAALPEALRAKFGGK